MPLQELNKSESVLRARAIVAFHLGNFRFAIFVFRIAIILTLSMPLNKKNRDD